MAYDNLSDFLNELHDDGELVRIRTEVDPVLEITEIADRVSKSPGGGPALFFERVKGSSMPVVINLLGSYKRMCRAMGVQSFEEVADRIRGAVARPIQVQGKPLRVGVSIGSAVARDRATLGRRTAPGRSPGRARTGGGSSWRGFGRASHSVLPSRK